MKKLLEFLRTKFFATKVLPALFFLIPSFIEIHKAISGIHEPTALEFIAFSIAAILPLNLFTRKYWLSCAVGIVSSLGFFFLIFAVFSEYSEFSNPFAFDALRLLTLGLLLCLSGVAMGIMLMVPFKPAMK